ncbi:hypothetical protein GC169_01505 [bacterium]|nr:hypothetical protein [bacterium]
MIHRCVAAALLLCAYGAAAAPMTAQVPYGLGPVSPDNRRMAENDDTNAHRYNEAVEALKGGNFGVAEALFEDIVAHDRNDAGANFMLGVAKMGLEKWAEAKPYLEKAVKRTRRDPDPKSRLAITLIKLGDISGARVQRAELVKLQGQCKRSCKNAEWIASSLAMVDAALPAAGMAAPTTPDR